MVDWDKITRDSFGAVDGVKAVHQETGKECIVCLDFDEVVSDENTDYQNELEQREMFLTVLNSELPYLTNKQTITTLKDNKSYEVVKHLKNDGICSKYVVRF